MALPASPSARLIVTSAFTSKPGSRSYRTAEFGGCERCPSTEQRGRPRRPSRAAAALALAGGLFFTPAATTLAQSTWDVTAARGKTRQIDFTTSEGTWQSVDISPDGRWIVFDLLGHVYRVPAAGGTAEALTQESGVALNYHPRYSPDGTRIAFISDRAGQNNLWTMGADGTRPEPVFLDPVTRLTEPTWTPDGRAIVAVRHFPTYSMHRRSARIWRFPLAGEPEELVGAPSGTQAYWPSVSTDGRSLYFQSSTFAEPLHGRQRTQHIRRLDLASKAISLVTMPESERWYWNDGAIEMAPEVSPDGRWLAFARRIPGAATAWRGHTYQRRTALWLRDLQTGAERILMDPITLDMAEAHGMKNLRIIPGYAWARDGKSLVLSQGGKLRRVWVADGRVETIPFTARVRRTVSEQARSTHDIDDGPIELKMLRWPVSSSDGRTLVFAAGGWIWALEAGGVPRRLTADSLAIELMPALSPDGKWVAWASWTDGLGGHLWKVPIGGGAPIRLTADAGEYLSPAWSADGTAIFASRGTGATTRGLGMASNLGFELVRVPVAGGSPTVVRGSIAPVGLSLGPGGRLYFVEQRGVGDVQVLLAQGKPVPETYSTLVSIAPDGSDRREHVRLPSAEEIVPSPDGRWVAFRDQYDAYVARLNGTQPRYTAPLAWTTGLVRLDPNSTGDSVRRVSREGGYDLRWRSPTVLEYQSGRRHFAHDLATGRTDTTPVSLEVPNRSARGTVALTNARIVTLDQRRVIGRGTVVVSGGRIACVGRCDAGRADRVVNLSGATIVPGFVDVHAHHLQLGGAIPDHRQHRPESALYLAYGVTTALDPSVEPIGAFTTAELVNAGRVLGPRTFSTGEGLMPPPGSNGPASYEEMAWTVNRLADWGAVAIKFYLAPRRDQRQWVAEAARRRGLSVTNEGADLEYNLSCVLDGHTGWEHPMMYVPLERDAALAFGQAGAIYSPTLTVASAGYWAEEYWQSRARLWDDPKQRRFVPWERLVRSINPAVRPLEEYSFPMMAEAIADLVRAGGYASLGGHGEQIGLDSHWEIWAYGMALTPMEALEVASLGGARMAGLEDDLGSVTVGKLADLVVLGSNPLEDIRRTTDIRYVMKGGRLFDGSTLDEIWPDARPYGPVPWAAPEVYRGGIKPIEVWDR